MKELMLKKVSEIVAGDVFFVGVSSECTFLVKSVEELADSFSLLIESTSNRLMTGYQSYPKSEVLRLSSWN